MFNLDGNFDAVMGFIGCIIGLEEIYVSSKRALENIESRTDLDMEIDKILVNNKHVFLSNEKLPKTKTFVSREDE